MNNRILSKKIKVLGVVILCLLILAYILYLLVFKTNLKGNNENNNTDLTIGVSIDQNDNACNTINPSNSVSDTTSETNNVAVNPEITIGLTSAPSISESFQINNTNMSSNSGEITSIPSVTSLTSNTPRITYKVTKTPEITGNITKTPKTTVNITKIPVSNTPTILVSKKPTNTPATPTSIGIISPVITECSHSDRVTYVRKVKEENVIIYPAWDEKVVVRWDNMCKKCGKYESEFDSEDDFTYHVATACASSYSLEPIYETIKHPEKKIVTYEEFYDLVYEKCVNCGITKTECEKRLNFEMYEKYCMTHKTKFFE